MPNPPALPESLIAGQWRSGEIQMKKSQNVLNPVMAGFIIVQAFTQFNHLPFDIDPPVPIISGQAGLKFVF